MADKIKLENSELALQFKEAIHRLMQFNRLYDGGQRFFARDIAAVTFQITVNTGKNTSLLRHLSIEEEVRILSYKTGPVSLENLMAENALVTMRTSVDEEACRIDWLPLDLPDTSAPFPTQWLRPKEWLRERVVKDSEKEFWSRQQLISAVRNMEGSHVDRFVSPSFKKLKEGSPFGVGVMSDKPIVVQPYSHIYAAVRHMGAELEESIKAIVKV